MKRLGLVVCSVVALTTCFAASAAAQYSAPKMTTAGAPGEKYIIEVSGSFWNPNLAGNVASTQFGQEGTKIDFVTDLNFQKTRFRDVRFVLHPGKRHKLRAQYTPVSYTGESTLARQVIFNGQKFDINLPINSTFDWKVWRFGYQVDVVSMPRGYVGLLFEGRLTEFAASVKSPATAEFTRAKAPLPALGIVARAYPIPQASLSFEFSGFKVPDVSPDYGGNYYDWDIYGTYNVNRYIGVQAGWRQLSTFVQIEKDSGDFKFQGLWFGGVIRY
jgi:hypothetical protein